MICEVPGRPLLGLAAHWAWAYSIEFGPMFGPMPSIGTGFLDGRPTRVMQFLLHTVGVVTDTPTVYTDSTSHNIPIPHVLRSESEKVLEAAVTHLGLGMYLTVRSAARRVRLALRLSGHCKTRKSYAFPFPLAISKSTSSKCRMFKLLLRYSRNLHEATEFSARSRRHCSCSRFD